MQNKTKYIIFGSAIFLLSLSVFLYMRHKVRRYAKKFIGQKEISGNQGFVSPEFEKKMKSVGWYNGAEWCSFFAKAIWIDKHPALKTELSKLMSGSSQDTWNNFVKYKSGKLKIDNSNKQDKFEIDTEKAKSGDVVVWQKYSGGQPTSDYKGHVGIVTRAYSSGFSTIEGNEANQVSEREHDYKEFNVNNGLRLKGFIRVA